MRAELPAGSLPALVAATFAEDLAPRLRLMPKMIFIERDGSRREVEAPLGCLGSGT